MPLLDNPLDTSFKGTFRGLNKLSMRARWGWTLGWGIAPAFALYFALTNRGGSAISLMLAWIIGVYLSALRMDGRSFGGSRLRVWLPWVILEYIMCAFVIIITLFPNP